MSPMFSLSSSPKKCILSKLKKKKITNHSCHYLPAISIHQYWGVVSIPRTQFFLLLLFCPAELGSHETEEEQHVEHAVDEGEEPKMHEAQMWTRTSGKKPRRNFIPR